MIDLQQLWAELPRAHSYKQLLNRVQRIRNTLYYRDPNLPREMHVILNDADAAAILPHFGFSKTGNPGYRADPQQPSTFWEREQCHWQLQNHLALICDDVAHTLLDDGRLHQRIPADAVIRHWQEGIAAATSYQDFTLKPSLPHYVAFTLATYDVQWTVSEDKQAVERILRAQPFRCAPTSAPLWLHIDSGLTVHVLCWAVLNEGQAPFVGRVPELAYLSLVGSHKKLKAVWAWLMDSKRKTVKLPQDNNRPVTYGHEEHVAARRIEAKGSYVQLWPDAPLQESGLAHLVIQHASECKPRVGEGFLHVGGLDGHPDLAHFIRQWEVASPYPAQPAWANSLWHDGRTAKLIAPLTARGMSAWWVSIDDPAWDRIIARCAAGRDIAVQIEVIGQRRHDLVAAAVDDCDDE